MSKVKYTYSTDEKRLEELKILAIKSKIPLNNLLDEALDEYLEKIEMRKTFFP